MAQVEADRSLPVTMDNEEEEEFGPQPIKKLEVRAFILLLFFLQFHNATS